jgi:hypothetical protein
MNFKTFKTTAAVAALILGIAVLPSAVNAQETVNASIETNAAITTADGDDIDFGEWFLIFRNADAFSLVMTTAGVITPTGLGGGATDSQAALLTAGATAEGTVTVDLPVGANGIELTMTRTAIDATGIGAGLTLQDITYGTVTEGANLVLAEATPEPVTVVTGGVPEVVSFGATFAVSAQPPDQVHLGTFDVSFAY